jgi:hemoglobin
MKSISNKIVIALAFGVFFFAGTPAFAQQAKDNAPAPASSDDNAIPMDEPAEDASVDNSAEANTDTATSSANGEKMTNASPAMNPAPADPKLLPVFKQFGELPGLTALMEDFMTQLLADPRTRPFFEQADQTLIKKHLTEQFCVILGGPCTYTGRDMKTVHAGLGITRGDFNALVEDLQIAMNKHHVPYHAQNKLLAKLAPLHRDIETK